MRVKLYRTVVMGVVCLGAWGWSTSPLQGQQGEVDHTVELTNITFKPDRIKVSPGDRIKFINTDKFDHDVFLVRTANRNIILVPPTTIHAGQSITIKVDQEGLFTLYCTIHGGMRAKITTTENFELSKEEKEKFAKVKVIPPIVHTGEELFWGRAQCHRCHQIADRGDGLRAPNLEDVGFRGAVTAKKLGMETATDYILQSIMEPSAHLVEGYSDDMPMVYQPPINLSADDIKAVITYLQSQGGDVDEWSIEVDEEKLHTKPALDPFFRGDSKRGALVFRDIGCGSCHTMGDRKAISVGPELTEIGAFRNWTWLAKSIIDPNAEVGANWHGATVYLKPGAQIEGEEKFEEFLDDDEEEGAAPTQVTGGTETGTPAYPSEDLSGIIRKNTSEEVILLVGDNQYRKIPGDKIDHMDLDAKSRMPMNFGDLLTFQQMADLIRFLESAKGPAPPASTAAK